MQYITQSYEQAKKRLMLFDYDGTLAPFADDPTQAKPSPKVLQTLKSLSSIPENTVVIISGRDHATLQAWLGHLPILMYAEHGVLRHNKNGTWDSLVANDMPWHQAVRQLFDTAAKVINGSFIETKTAGLAWHYRAATSADAAQKQRRFLLSQLSEAAKNNEFEILDGNKVIEAKPVGITKGTAATELLASFPSDFVLCAGDDITDEAMFKVLPKSAHSIKIGAGQTNARFTLPACSDFVALLAELAAKP
ncbi:MAG TPA: trehalose-phosphatase [Candidatus Saccharimonadales bacterium]|nr:trehalose-phosphatase [Candidatus Saccharimonadales bacterium]